MNKIEELEKEFENLVDEFEKKLEDLKKRFDECEKSEKGNKRWRAEYGETYFYIDSDLLVEDGFETRDTLDNNRYKIHNYFKTKEEAEKVAEKIKIYVELKDLAEELNAGEEIDWNNTKQSKHCIWNEYCENGLYSETAFSCRHLIQIYSLNKDFLEIANERIGEERLLKLFE